MKSYPEWNKRLDRIHDKLWPEYSERLFIRLMGPLWFWTHGFEHQGRLGPWRPDFMSQRKRLIIEVDSLKKIPSDIVKQAAYFKRMEERDMSMYRYGYSVFHVMFKDIRDRPSETRRAVKQWVANPAKYRQQNWSGRNP